MQAAIRTVAGPAALFLLVAGIFFGANRLAWRSAYVAQSPATEERGFQLPAAAFPLSVAAGGHYLVDSKGKPFLMNGDTAWSLIADLSRDEVDLYLRDRKARGFNTLLVNLIEHKYARNAPANANGDAPFRVAGDFGTPNEAYFKHADWVLERARAMGFLVLLAPAYVGYRDSGEGWYEDMVASGTAKLRDYGRFVGERYRHLDNILWVHAGDDNPPDKSIPKAVVDGIAEAGGDMLQTAHTAPETSAASVWWGEPWLQVGNVYTYGPTCPPSLKEYFRAPPRPFFLMESAYENEHGAGALRARSQAYHALLCGAAGHVFGNNPIWHFNSAGLYWAALDWRQSLASRGARSMTQLARLFASLPWWRLVPDAGHTLLKAQAGADANGAVAAVTGEGDVAVLYLPEGAAPAVQLSRLKGPQVSAQWFDPASGAFSAAAPQPLATNGTRAFTAPGRNAQGRRDWVLVLRSGARAGRPESTTQ
jgi:Protein of unknown function (DUF4038)/Putative collagen-binding domain of a collagenase